MLKRFAILIACMLPFIGMGDVLLWAVDDSATVDGTQIKNWLMASPYVEDDDHWVAARVKLTDANGTILGIYFDGYVKDGTLGVEFSNIGGYWGSGVPTGNQSPTGYKTWCTSTEDPATTILDNPAAIEALFIMELGYNAYDPGIDDYVWTTIAQSVPAETYEALRANYMYGEGTLGPHDNKVWIPTDFYTMNPPMPEPSSSLLFLVGASLLILKRNGTC